MTGVLDIIGLGPGAPEHRTLAAAESVRGAQTVIGYEPYLEQCRDLLRESSTVVRWQMGEEPQRALQAVQRAAGGERVALVSSGDPGVYGMAARTLALVAELAPERRPLTRVLPGVTAALAASALLGAPLADDFAVISLSDLRLAWETIERRVTALASSGIALCLYNPRSRTRTRQLTRVLEILRAHRPPDTPVALVTDASRAGQRMERTTLDTVDEERVTMRTTLIVAGESAAAAGDWLVALR
jgi:precorrin-3B C17-methyltransferase